MVHARKLAAKLFCSVLLSSVISSQSLSSVLSPVFRPVLCPVLCPLSSVLCSLSSVLCSLLPKLVSGILLKLLQASETPGSPWDRHPKPDSLKLSGSGPDLSDYLSSLAMPLKVTKIQILTRSGWPGRTSIKILTAIYQRPSAWRWDFSQKSGPPGRNFPKFLLGLAAPHT